MVNSAQAESWVPTRGDQRGRGGRYCGALASSADEDRSAKSVSAPLVTRRGAATPNLRRLG